MICRVNVLIVLLELATVYPECINTKTRTVSCVRWERKIIRIVLLWKRAIDTVDIFHEVQTRRKGFSSVSLPLRHFQAAGARTRSDKMGSCHLEL